MSVEDRALYEEMKDIADFENYPIPESWYREFNIKRKPADSVSEFIKSGYTTEIAFEPKNLPPLIINVPQQDGKLWTVPEFIEPEVSMTVKPFELAEGESFPAVLPGLRAVEVSCPDECPCHTLVLEKSEHQSPLPNPQ